MPGNLELRTLFLLLEELCLNSSRIFSLFFRFVDRIDAGTPNSFAVLYFALPPFSTSSMSAIFRSKVNALQALTKPFLQSKQLKPERGTERTKNGTFLQQRSSLNACVIRKLWNNVQKAPVVIVQACVAFPPA